MGRESEKGKKPHMDRKPVIGITPGFMRNLNKLSLSQGYTSGIIKAGGLAVILPLCNEKSIIENIFMTVDGILFSGGPDIDARYFGEENMKCGGEIVPERDGFELLLAKKAMENKMPVLGICRGMQLINTALGGTIYQDIHACRSGEIVLKHRQDAPDWYPVHDVSIASDSRLRRIYGTGTLGVNSFHHQAVNKPGSGLAVSAVASDGTIEAVEGVESSFIVGVQWHPELMWQENQTHLSIFEAFVEAAAGFSARDRRMGIISLKAHF